MSLVDRRGVKVVPAALDEMQAARAGVLCYYCGAPVPEGRRDACSRRCVSAAYMERTRADARREAHDTAPPCELCGNAVSPGVAVCDRCDKALGGGARREKRPAGVYVIDGLTWPEVVWPEAAAS